MNDTIKIKSNNKINKKDKIEILDSKKNINFNDQLGIYCEIFFFFILIITGSFISELFNCSIKNILKHNIYIKHIFGLFIMYFLATVSNTNLNNNSEYIKKGFYLLIAIVLYLIFILISKMYYIYAFIILFLIFTIYIINTTLYSHLTHLYIQNNDDNEDTDNDIDVHKIEHTVHNKTTSISKEKIFFIINIILLILIFLLLIYGLLINIANKKLIYKNKFSIFTFFLDIKKCNYKKIDKIKNINKIFKILNTKY